MDCILVDLAWMQLVSSCQQVMANHNRAHHNLLVESCALLGIRYQMLDSHVGKRPVLQEASLPLFCSDACKVQATFCHTPSPAKAAEANGTFLTAELLNAIR